MNRSARPQAIPGAWRLTSLPATPNRAGACCAMASCSSTTVGCSCPTGAPKRRTRARFAKHSAAALVAAIASLRPRPGDVPGYATRIAWADTPPGRYTADHPARTFAPQRSPSGVSGCSRRSPPDSCSWTPRGGSGSGPSARRGTATLVMAHYTSRLAKVPRSRPLSRDRTRCPRCPASRGTTRCRRRQAVVARVQRRARPVVRIRPQVRPGALPPRARCRPARQDAADS